VESAPVPESGSTPQSAVGPETVIVPQWPVGPMAVAADSVIVADPAAQQGRAESAQFEAPLWRALAVFRFATLAYAVALGVSNLDRYQRPVAGWGVFAVMTGWSAVTVSGYARPRLRDWPLLSADFVVTAACLMSSRWVVGPAALASSIASTTLVWMVCPVLAWAVARGRRWGALAAVAMGCCDLLVRAQINQATLTGSVIMLVAAVAVGHLARLAAAVSHRLRAAAELEAATRERERLARGIHDSILQVLALVQRRGTELGGEAAELGRLAGAQERALRALVSAGPAAPAGGRVDLRRAIGRWESDRVTVATPATAVWQPAGRAEEIAAAVAAALDNVHRHGGPVARTWILLEEPDAVTVTVRDDGPGIPPGELERAAAQGRLGVKQAIRGRIEDLGGTVAITSVPDEGTEVEIRLPLSA
jgi:signal transduction histidine kinase